MKKQFFQHSGYNKANKRKAILLRKLATKEEKRLWYDFLSKMKPRFYRQRPIDGYIADFYCPKARIAIELDGSQHFSDEGKAYDEYRTRIINKYGIDVIRFTNFDINTNFSNVCYSIENRVRDVMSSK